MAQPAPLEAITQSGFTIKDKLGKDHELKPLDLYDLVLLKKRMGTRGLSTFDLSAEDSLYVIFLSLTKSDVDKGKSEEDVLRQFPLGVVKDVDKILMRVLEISGLVFDKAAVGVGSANPPQEASEASPSTT